MVGGVVFFPHGGLLAVALKGGADEPARQPLGCGHAADEASVAVDRKRRQQLALGLVQVGHVAKTDLPAQGVQRHGKAGQGPQQSQTVKGACHHQPRGLAQRLALGIGHGPFITATLNALHLLTPAHLHARGLQLGGHQLPGPNPARLRVPERGRVGRQPCSGNLRRAGRSAVPIGGVRWQEVGQASFARQVVFQNTREGPIGTALQQRLGALQRGLHPRTRDAREHVVVG